MSVLIHDETIANEVLRKRLASGMDRYDEVWDGVYVMSPMADNQHQALATQLSAAICTVIDWCSLGQTLAGANVSDRADDWTSNYRIPDVLVFLKETTAIDRGTHWFGGPDFAIEIASPGDRPLDKVSFYAKVGTRELLIINRNPLEMILYRLVSNELLVVGKASYQQPHELESQILPIKLQLDLSPPSIRLTHRDGAVIRSISVHIS